MAFLKIKNRAISTLAAGINDSVTELSVAAGEGALFPGSTDFHITIDDEIMTVTGVSTDTFTVTRGAESTTPAAHSSTTPVELRITAGVLSAMEAEIEAKVAKSGFTAAEDILVGTGSGTFAKKTPAEVMAILSGEAAAAFSLNSQNITDLANAFNPKDAVNLDDLLDRVGVVLNYWISNQTLSMTLTDSEAALTEQPSTPVETLSTITFKSTVIHTPTPFVIKAGALIEIHVDAKVSSGAGRSVGLHCVLGYVDANGSSNFQQIGADSGSTGELTTSQTGYLLHLHVENDTEVPLGKRLWLKFVSTSLSGGGTYPTISVYYDDPTHHLVIPVAGSVLGAYVPYALFDANTILAANSDNTPIALSVAEQRIVGRITGQNIQALTAAQIRTLIGVADGADVTGDNAPQAHAASHVWLGSDELNLKNFYIAGMLDDYYFSWRNLDGFTDSDSGSGASIVAGTQMELPTGAVNNSEAFQYANAAMFCAQDTVVYNQRVGFWINWRTASIAAHTGWFGLFGTPWAGLTDVQTHFAWKILNGSLYASCANGGVQTITDTGLDFQQYRILQLFMEYGDGFIRYWAKQDAGAWTLKATHSANIPVDVGLYLTFYLKTTEAVAKEAWMGVVKVISGEVVA